jgi:hypothetical protein
MLSIQYVYERILLILSLSFLEAGAKVELLFYLPKLFETFF